MYGLSTILSTARVNTNDTFTLQVIYKV